MTLVEVLQGLFTDYTIRTVALGSATLGIVSGALGCFAVLRRQSLLGDAISHTALPGVALAFLLTGSRLPLVLLAGAALSGWLGTLTVMAVVRRSRIKTDSALGMVLAVFFGFGLVLMTYVQRTPEAGKAGLDKFLFGQASTLMSADVWTMGVIGAIALALLFLFWKEFKLLAFDQEFGTSMGFPMRVIDILLTTLLVAAIVIGLQTVGVVLMSAMVVAPAAAARQWTDRLGLMLVLSSVFGAVAGVSGALLSSLTERLPTGPTIVLCVSAIVLISLLFAPNRGLVYNWLRSFRQKRDLALDAVLLDLLELAGQHESLRHPHTVATLQSMNGRPRGVPRTLDELKRLGWAEAPAPGLWHLTDKGESKATRRFSELGSVR
ncbi:MAG: metal ABC transporter permease [bacterium]|nr:metal ABC transporter permease [bacterium]